MHRDIEKYIEKHDTKFKTIKTIVINTTQFITKKDKF